MGVLIVHWQRPEQCQSNVSVGVSVSYISVSIKCNLFISNQPSIKLIYIELSLQDSTAFAQTDHSVKFESESSVMGCVNGRNILSEEDIDFIARNTAMEREQVEHQYQPFIQRHPDGRISRKSFHQMMKECYPGADTERLERHIFRMYDSNQDGYIDFREFMVVLYIMSNGTPEENLRQIFRVFDINNDGKISVPEMRKIVSDLFHLINISTKDTRSEEDVADSAFKEMDENQDGEVTQDEFIKACLCQKKFSSMLALKIVNIFISDK